MYVYRIWFLQYLKLYDILVISFIYLYLFFFSSLTFQFSSIFLWANIKTVKSFSFLLFFSLRCFLFIPIIVFLKGNFCLFSDFLYEHFCAWDFLVLSCFRNVTFSYFWLISVLLSNGAHFPTTVRIKTNIWDFLWEMYEIYVCGESFVVSEYKRNFVQKYVHVVLWILVCHIKSGKLFCVGGLP